MSSVCLSSAGCSVVCSSDMTLLFPFSLFLICLFVGHIAIAVLRLMPAGSTPDLYVLTLPLTADQDWIALLAFLGGFSSATSMVIVSSIALSTMISNHIVMPLALRFSIVPATSVPDVRGFILIARRTSSVFIVLHGSVYFRSEVRRLGKEGVIQ